MILGLKMRKSVKPEIDAGVTTLLYDMERETAQMCMLERERDAGCPCVADGHRRCLCQAGELGCLDCAMSRISDSTAYVFHVRGIQHKITGSDNINANHNDHLDHLDT